MVTVEGDGNCFPRALAIACQPARIRGVTRRFAAQPAITSLSAGLAWAGRTSPTRAPPSEGATKCRIDREWLEMGFILAYCHIRRINATLAMLDWRKAESGRREPYLVKQLLTGAPDRLRYSHGLLAYVNRNHHNAAIAH